MANPTRSLAVFGALIGSIIAPSAIAEPVADTRAVQVAVPGCPAMEATAMLATAPTHDGQQRFIDQQLKTVYKLRREQKYEQALKAVDQVLLIDPDHEGAKHIREMLVEAIMVVGVRNLYQQQYLLGVGHRRDPNPPAPLSVESLDRTIRITQNWRGMSLNDAAAALSKTMNTRVDIDWARFQDTPVSEDTAIAVTFENVKPTLVMDAIVRHLRALAPHKPAVWVIRDGAIQVTTTADPTIEPTSGNTQGEVPLQWRTK